MRFVKQRVLKEAVALDTVTIPLRIRFRSDNGDGQAESGEMRATGALEQTDFGWVLAYREPGEGEDAPGAAVRMEMRAANEVWMERRGEASSSAHYVQGQESDMLYDVLGNTLAMRVLSHTVRWAVIQAQGSILLRYTLSFSQEESLHHRIEIRMGEAGSPTVTGEELFEQARGLLQRVLGKEFGFLRWLDDTSDALLITDAGRRAEKRGRAAEGEDAVQALTHAGWRVQQTDGLWRLDPPQSAYHRALAARHVMPLEAGEDAWADGQAAAWQAVCAGLLRQPPDGSSTADDDAMRRMLREAWKHTAQQTDQLEAWLRARSRTWAERMRNGGATGQYACGVLLQRCLWQQGYDVPREAF